MPLKWIEGLLPVVKMLCKSPLQLILKWLIVFVMTKPGIYALPVSLEKELKIILKAINFKIKWKADVLIDVWLIIINTIMGSQFFIYLICFYLEFSIFLLTQHFLFSGFWARRRREKWGAKERMQHSVKICFLTKINCRTKRVF